MKILMLTPYLPYPLLTGGQTRSYNLIKRLSSLGHKITLFSLIKSEKEREYVGNLKKYCEEVSLLTQPFIKDDQKTIQDIINDYILKLGENIAVKRFVRFQI